MGEGEMRQEEATQGRGGESRREGILQGMHPRRKSQGVVFWQMM